MKKNQVDAIFVDDAIRRKKIISFIFAIVILFILSIVFLGLFFKNNKVKYVKYNESSNIDYKVFLKKNDFFEDKYLVSDKQYISTLIDYISANFKYTLSLDEKNVTYKYSYRVVANVNVQDKSTKKNIYNYSDTLISSKSLSSDKKSLTISEDVDIDYNKYNDLISKFVSTYDVGDAVSSLTVNMYVSVIGSCEDFNDSKNESVMTLTIPLTTKTMGIDLSNDLVNTEDNLMLCTKPSSVKYLYLIISGVFALSGVICIVSMVMYTNKTRTAKSVYQKELKKILNNYSPYIQKVNGSFNLRGYQVLRINMFTDMLEIRDTLQQPILMIENEKRDGVFFIIPSNTKILYVYGIKVSDIEREMRKAMEEDKEESNTPNENVI